jgi:hypothetical protein
VNKVPSLLEFERQTTAINNLIPALDPSTTSGNQPCDDFDYGRQDKRAPICIRASTVVVAPAKIPHPG